MANLNTFTTRHATVFAFGVALLACLLYIVFKTAEKVTIDPQQIASQKIADYAERENLMPDLFRLDSRTDGPDGRQFFDYEYEAPRKHAVRIDVSKDGSVEVSRMLD